MYRLKSGYIGQGQITDEEYYNLDKTGKIKYHKSFSDTPSTDNSDDYSNSPFGSVVSDDSSSFDTSSDNSSSDSGSSFDGFGGGDFGGGGSSDSW